MKLLLIGMTVALAVSASAGNVTIPWDASSTPTTLGDAATGLLEFTYAGGAVKTITATPVDGGTIVLTGDAIAFAASATNAMAAAGRLVISNELSGSGTVTMVNADAAAQIVYSGALLYTNRWTTMFTGRQLADYAPVKSVRREGTGVYDAGIYYPYNVRRYEDGGVSYMSIQLMASQPTTTRALLMRLRQNGDNIEGIVDRACYYAGRFIHGEDIEKVIERHAINPEDGFVPSYYVHTPDFDHGYGVNHLVMEKTVVPEVVFAGTAAPELSFTVTHGIIARASEGGLDGSTLSHSFPLAGGTMQVNGRVSNSENLKSSVAGHGSFALLGAEASGADTCTDSYAGFVKSAVNVCFNRRLATLTNVTANLSGSYFSETRTAAVFYPYGSGTGLALTGELQVASNDTTLRFVLLAIEQNAQNIRAIGIKAGYVRLKSGATSVVGKYSAYDENIPNRGTGYNPNFKDDLTVATADSGSHIGACDFRFMFSEPAAKMFNLGDFTNFMAPEEVVRNEQNAYEGIKLRIAGTPAQRMLARVTSWTAYPTNGVVEVGPYGELCAARAGSEGDKSLAQDTALIRVYTNGTLRTYANYALGSYQHVHLLGGMLISRDDLVNTATDSSCYYNLLTLRDGALVTGAPLRVGFAGAASWRVAGNTPSTCAASLLLKSLNNNTYKTVEFNVTDVTDDDGIDFHLRGNVDALDNTHSNIVLRKTGGGTLAQHGVFASRLAPAPVKIEAGVWQLCGTASPNQDYNLAGGTLVASGEGNSAGRLLVSASGTLKVASGSTIAFADSSAVSWNIPSNGKLQIDADLDAGAIRFGEADNALTVQQLSRMRHGKAHVKLDDAGYLRDRIDGVCIIFR